jgi:hypothetical protein
MRRFRLVGVVIASLVFSGIVYGQGRRDGQVWTGMSPEIRASYVQGLIDGSGVGASLVEQGIPVGNACRQQVMPGYRMMDKKLLVGISPSQIVGGMDSIFKDKRNQPILMSDVFYITLQEIHGMPRQDIELLLAVMRKPHK